MALGNNRRHWRMEALTVAAELIRGHGGTDAMEHLSDEDAEIFDQECRKLAEFLEKKATKLGYKGHASNKNVSIPNIR